MVEQRRLWRTVCTGEEGRGGRGATATRILLGNPPLILAPRSIESCSIEPHPARVETSRSLVRKTQGPRGYRPFAPVTVADPDHAVHKATCARASCRPETRVVVRSSLRGRGGRNLAFQSSRGHDVVFRTESLEGHQHSPGVLHADVHQHLRGLERAATDPQEADCLRGSRMRGVCARSQRPARDRSLPGVRTIIRCRRGPGLLVSRRDSEVAAARRRSRHGFRHVPHHAECVLFAPGRHLSSIDAHARRLKLLAILKFDRMRSGSTELTLLVY